MAAAAAAPRPARRAVAFAGPQRDRGGAADPLPSGAIDICVHGRHVDVTPDVEARVKARLAPVLERFKGAAILEADGGVAAVDVRLMNSEARVTLRPRAASHDAAEAYVRRGRLEARAEGGGWDDALARALDALDKKLHRYAKPPPRKVDYRRL